MKNLVLFIAMLISLSAVAQQKTDWEDLPMNLRDIVAVDQAQVKIMQSDANKIKIISGGKDAASVKTWKDVASYRSRCLTIGDDVKAEIYVAEDMLFRLYINARDNANINITSKNKGDTLNHYWIVMESYDNAKITIDVPIKSWYVTMTQNDQSKIEKNSVIISNVSNSNSEEFAKISMKGGDVDSSFETGPIEKYTSFNRLNMGFYFGWNNWGESPVVGLAGVPDAYNAKNTLSALTFEMSYSIICREHFAAGLGLGIGRNKIKFTNPYVAYGEHGLVTDMPTDKPYQKNGWKSYYFTRQISFPIHFNYYASMHHYSGFSTSITIIPMLHLATNRAGLNNRYDGSGDMDKEKWHEKNTTSPLNTFNCDIRASITYYAVSLYLQTSMLPLLDKSKMDNKNLYPVSLGLGIVF